MGNQEKQSLAKGSFDLTFPPVPCELLLLSLLAGKLICQFYIFNRVAFN